MKAILILAFSLSLAGLAGQLRAQNAGPMSVRLSAEKVSDVEPGLYSAGDGRSFSLSSYGDNFLLRFPESPENFVLTVDPVALGAKILKYDTGATALRVSVWGGLTLYAADAPGGLPATRQGDSATLVSPAVSAADLETALNDEANHFSYVDNMALHFTADASATANADTRAMAFDTLGNAQLGIERLIGTSPAARQALAHRIDTVKIETGPKPCLALAGSSLLVIFTPAEGLSGRASSHVVAHQLGKLLAVNTPE